MVLPVLVRELRRTSRHAGTYWFRTTGAGVATLFLASILASQASARSPSGLPSFLAVNAVLVAVTWLFCPLLAADCLSGEKREGTLGLLFLTPLTVRDVIIAKLFTQVWRAGTLFLAMMPILLVPVLMGGVSWQLGLVVAAIHIGGLMVALMAGMLASSLAKELTRARVLACGFGVASALLFAAIVAEVSDWSRLFGTAGGASPSYRDAWKLMSENLIRGELGDAFKGISRSLLLPQLATAGVQRMVEAAAVILAVGMLWAIICLGVAGALLRRSRYDRPMTRRQERIWRLFCSPLFWRTLFTRHMQRQRSRNPVAWLDQYSWSARSARWGWCFFFIAVELWLLSFWEPETAFGRERMMGLLLAAAVGLSAVGSFQQAVRSGLLELLLVTPMREWGIIQGRLKALFHQFLPSVLVMMIVYYSVPLSLPEVGVRTLPQPSRGIEDTLQGAGVIERFGLVWGSIGVQCASVALVGMAFSLMRAPSLAAWAGTWLIVCVGPYLVGVPVWGIASLVGLTEGGGGLFALFWRFVLGVVAGWGIYLLLIYDHALFAGVLVAAGATVVALIDEGVVGHVILASIGQALIAGYAIWRLYDGLANGERVVSPPVG